MAVAGVAALAARSARELAKELAKELARESASAWEECLASALVWVLALARARVAAVEVLVSVPAWAQARVVAAVAWEVVVEVPAWVPVPEVGELAAEARALAPVSAPALVPASAQAREWVAAAPVVAARVWAAW